MENSHTPGIGTILNQSTTFSNWWLAEIHQATNKWTKTVLCWFIVLKTHICSLLKLYCRFLIPFGFFASWRAVSSVRGIHAAGELSRFQVKPHEDVLNCSQRLRKLERDHSKIPRELLSCIFKFLWNVLYNSSVLYNMPLKMQIHLFVIETCSCSLSQI